MAAKTSSVNSQPELISARVALMCFQISPPSGLGELQLAAQPLHTGCGFSSAWRQREGAVHSTKPDKMAPTLALRGERWDVGKVTWVSE